MSGEVCGPTAARCCPFHGFTECLILHRAPRSEVALRNEGEKFATGGNDINFHSTNLHSSWDSVTVTKAMAAAGQTTPRAFAQTFIASPPPGWQTGSFISGWAVKWANEVLPIATEAHARLTFHANAKSWGAKSSDLPGYDQWAREQVSLELGRAGYRLAAILKKVWP